jgi:hypothetical protein
MPVAIRLTVNAAAANRAGIKAAKLKVTDVTRQVLNRADVLTPVDTGNLRRNNHMRVKTRRSQVTGEVYNPTKYADWVHNGTRPHVIQPKKKRLFRKRKKALRFEVAGEVVFAAKVNHPGTPGQPWLRQAMEEIAPRYGFVVTR